MLVNRPRTSCKLQTAWFLAIGILVLSLFGSRPALSQEAHPLPAPSTELGQENLSRVAASPEEVKLLLLKDSGLMVEVKRWIAKDATADGQIVGDSDLTDEAIFERLSTDIRFRSTVTVICQRYGHFLPKLDPESETARQRELLLQERAKILARAFQDDLTAARSRSWKRKPGADACDSQTDEKCVSSGEANNTQPFSQGVAPPSTTPEVPSRPSSPNRATIPVDRAQANYPGDATETLSPLGGAETQALSGRLPVTNRREEGKVQGAEILPIASSGGERLEPPLMNDGVDDELPINRQGPSMTISPEQNLWLPPDSPAPLSTVEGSRKKPEPRSEPPELLRTATPYKDIPSLYDMYVQAVPRPSAPRRFGSQVFENGTRDSHLMPMDLTVGPDYVVGPGDALSIDLWGGITQRLYRVVDHGGQISLPDVGPMLVSGKNLADIQKNLEKLLRTEFRDLSADVSLSRMRTIRVYEVGEVANPGAYDVTSLSTPLNAMFAAGGPTQAGSLRLVKHLRGGQVLQIVDLYDLLLNGVRPDLQRLENGDTILVPPVGPQVTVEGMIRRPAIYELRNERNLASVLELAGGLLPTASLRHIEVQRVVAHEKQTMLALEIQESDDAKDITRKLTSFKVDDGDRIRVFAIAPYNQDVIYLAGHVAHPGLYSFHPEMRVTDVIASYRDVLPEPARQYAEIIRLNAPDFHPSVESFDLAEALANPSQAPTLQAMDTIRVFSRFDFEAPPIVAVRGAVRQPGTYRTSGQIRLSDAIYLAGGLAEDATTSDVQVVRQLPDGRTRISSVDLRLALAGDPKANILLQPRDQLLIHWNPISIEPATVYVRGEVGKPGRYPLAADMTVADLIRMSGGLKPGADTQIADLTSYHWADHGNLSGTRQAVQISSALSGDPSANIKLSNGNVLTIRQLPGWSDLGASISINGEVSRPGTYGIRPGERLSSILERAGGFQPDAYVYGALLERMQVRELEAKQQTEMVLRIKSMQTKLEILPENNPEQKAAKESALQQYQSTLTQLTTSQPLGRVTIHISSEISHWKGTAADVEARAGDVLFIPKRPSFVMVSGQVFNPTAVGYRPGKSGTWYLSQSGGPTVLADKKGIFVIRADGSVIGGRESAWSGSSLAEVLQPGDTIVVPEKAVGGGVQWQSVFLAAQVASSIASTALIALKL